MPKPKSLRAQINARLKPASKQCTKQRHKPHHAVADFERISSCHIPQLTKCPKPNVSIATQPCLVFCFRETKLAERRPVSDEESMATLLRERVRAAEKTKEIWMRDPNAAWMKSLELELSPEDSRAVQNLRSTQAERENSTEESDAFKTWYERTIITEEILLRWFSTRTFEQVLHKAREFGHTDEYSGIALDGKYAQEALCVKKQLTTASLLPAISTLTRGVPSVSLYTSIKANCLQLDPLQSVAKRRILDEGYLDASLSAARQWAASIQLTTFAPRHAAACPCSMTFTHP